MNADKLVQMANGIGQFFDSMPDREEAIEGVANHLRRYWAPEMRKQLLAMADHGAIGSLHPLVALVLRERHANLLPAPGDAQSARPGSAGNQPPDSCSRG